MSKNHYHITVKCTADELTKLSKLTKSKPTSIDLHKDKHHQIDRMLTKYHRCLDTLKLKAEKDINQILSAGYEVVRLKIEQVVTSFTKQDVGAYKYLEGHIKVKSDKELPYIDGFILSGNNDKANTKFYNFRIRTESDYTKVFGNINLIQGELEREFERVVYDSNTEHDRWWG